MMKHNVHAHVFDILPMKGPYRDTEKNFDLSVPLKATAVCVCVCVCMCVCVCVCVCMCMCVKWIIKPLNSFKTVLSV